MQNITDVPAVIVPDQPLPDNPSPAVPSRINFNYFIQPFVQLLTSISSKFTMLGNSLEHYCLRIIVASQEIFYRLVTPPVFDPSHPSFKAQIAQLDDQIPLLQERVNQLDSSFRQNHLISRDMKELKQLHNEISEPLRRLNYYVDTLESRLYPFPIQEKLVSVRDAFKELNDQMEQFCVDQGDAIIKQLQQALNIFLKSGVELPEEVHQQLIQTWEDFHAVFTSHLRNQPSQAKSFSSKISDLKSQIQRLRQKSSGKTKNLAAVEPLQLKNIGNSCYLDAVLQCLCCLAQLLEKINEPIERDPDHLDEYQKKLVIQNELLQFIDLQKRSQGTEANMTQMEFILFLFGGPSLFRLRDAIFKSNLHPELTFANGLTAQHDAAYVIELFIDHFFADMCQYKWRGHASTPIFPGLEFLNGGKDGKDEDLSVLQVPLRPAKYQKLDALIGTFLGKHPEREINVANQRQFDPKDGEIIPGKEEEAQGVINASPAKAERYTQWYRLNHLPPVMVIQFKRFTGALKKDGRPVILPPDGILDLTQYYDAPEGEPKQESRYKIKGMVRHIGSTLRAGHYVAEVEIDGKYYHCDDLAPKNTEVTKTAFFGHKDPYLLFLERLPDEELEPLESPVVE